MIKSFLLSIVLSISFVSVSHAQEGNKTPSAKKEKKVERARQKVEKKDDVTYLDMSDSSTESKDDGMPSITPKGKI